MNDVKVKAILLDFDQTLFDTRAAKPYLQGKPDWDTILAKIADYPLFDGWEQVFTKLGHVPVGIVSRNTKTMVSKVLKYNKLNFDPMVTRYGNSKYPYRAQPKPVLFDIAMQHEKYKGLKNSEIIYIGDEASDVEQANEFGFLSGACYWGSLEPEMLDQTNPTVRLYSPLDLLSLVG
ncbi:MAG: HAD-IA family hydrolase [Bacteroidales bacterium]|nr:HAD-IA family hydrolase [Bacteroidales bacterium]